MSSPMILSASSLRAVIMITGTWDMARMALHTAKPSFFGIITSRNTMEISL